MPRQSRSSRPAARPAPAPAQTRSSSTAAAPAPSYGANPATSAPHPHPAASQHAPTQSGQPGMLAQMAATAGSVAVGSTIGHGISSMLFGGSSSAPAEQQQQTQAPPAQPRAGLNCEVQATDFTKCLEKADLNSCSYYLEQLKACQAAAAPY